MTEAIRPEDILPDDVNEATVQGVTVRKGSVAAVMANLSILESEESSPSEKTAALSVIKELIPGLIALGFHKHFTFKNAELQTLIESST